MKFLKIINKDYINDNNLLIYAAKKGKLPVVDLFIKNGADINKTDTDGMTPISRALSKMAKADNDGWTSIGDMEARLDVVRVLRRAGANASSEELKVYENANERVAEHYSV